MEVVYDNILNYDDNFYKEIYNLLNYSDKSHIGKLVRKNDKKLSLLGYFLLNKLLNKLNINYFNEEIIYNEYGKPKLKNHKNIHYNISHDNFYVTVAVNNKKIGIDIIDLNRSSIKINSICNFEELKLIKSKKDIFTMFTIKESYIKMLGSSILESNKIIVYNLNPVKTNKKVCITYILINNYLITTCTLR